MLDGIEDIVEHFKNGVFKICRKVIPQIYSYSGQKVCRALRCTAALKRLGHVFGVAYLCGAAMPDLAAQQGCGWAYARLGLLCIHFLGLCIRFLGLCIA